MYDYTYQKFTQAIECLAIGKGDIRERLKDAYLYYLHVLIHDTDFPIQLKDDRKYIITNLTKYKSEEPTTLDMIGIKYGSYERKGSIYITMNKIKRKTGKKIAERIFFIRERLHEIKFKE